MRLVHVSPRYFPAISGSEFYLQEISEILTRRGHLLTVLCSNALDFNTFGNPKGKVVAESRSIINGVPIYRYPIKYIPGISLFPGRSYRTFKKLLKFFISWQFSPLSFLELLTNGPFTPHLLLQLMQEIPDIIHTVCMPYCTNLFALLASQLRKVPTVCTPFYHLANPRYHHPSSIAFLNRFTRVLTCSNTETRFLMNHGVQRERLRRIHMGIRPDIYRRGRGDQFRKQFRIEEDQKLLLFCGYKNHEKGAITLLRSIPYIVRKNPDCKFIFIGPSTTAFNIEKRKLGLLRAHIINLGVVPYYAQIKLNAFAAHDIYVMPSRTDAYGIAFLEAWINKKPVIGANAGATPEIIRHGTDGLLVPFNSPVNLAKTILRLLANDHEARAMGEAGYEKIQNRTWDRVATRIEEIYQELI